MSGNRFAPRALACVLACALAAPAVGQFDPAFTYQGLLLEGGVPVDDTCDIMLTLFDVPSGGAPVTASETVLGVLVNDGLFTVTVDFGAGDFDGSPRWLELAVRCPGGAGAFVTLSPRQELTPSPYAIYALNAASAASAGGLVLPFAGSVSSASTAFSITNTDSGGAGHFELTSAANTLPALYAKTAGGLAIRAEATGTGLALLGIGTVLGSTGSSVAGQAGVRGEATNAAGATAGVHGSNLSTTALASGVHGEALGASGATYGVWGATASGDAGAAGVFGEASAGVAAGVSGRTTSDADGAAGVRGEALSGVAITAGVVGVTNSSAGGSAGVSALATAGAGITYGVQATNASATDGARAVYGAATAGTGMTAGVEGRTLSGTAGAAGVVGLAQNAGGATRAVYGNNLSAAADAIGVDGWVTAVTAVQNTGVRGTTNSTGNDSAGVRGRAQGATGRVYGVAGETDSATTDAAGVLGEANSLAGTVYGVHGTTVSNGAAAAGVFGEASAAAPGAGAAQATAGARGRTLAATRSVGVQGECIPFDAPPPPLAAQIGVRGYAPDTTADSVRVGVEGDASPGVTEPLAASGVRGWIKADPLSAAWSGVVGQAMSAIGANPDPEMPDGHVGVWGIAHSGESGSTGVLGDATADSIVNHGVRGRSQSTDSSASGVLAEGKGVAGAGSPQAAALDIRDGAIRVSGSVRPAGTVSVVGLWVPVISCVTPCPDCEHAHIIGFCIDVPLVNDLIVSDSIILVTVETVGTPLRPCYSAQIHTKTPGGAMIRVHCAGDPGTGICKPPTDVLEVHYQVINPD